MFENEALAALTFAESTIVAMEKEQVIAHFTKAVDQHGTAELSPVLAAAELAARLRRRGTSACSNARFDVQASGRCFIARATAETVRKPRAYGRTGGWADDSGAVPLPLPRAPEAACGRSRRSAAGL